MTAVEHTMDVYVNKIDDAVMKAALRAYDLSAVRARGDELLAAHPAPETSLMLIVNRNPADEQSARIGMLLSTLNSSETFDNAIAGGMKSARDE